jgi:2-iminoacetate synthase ThiH
VSVLVDRALEATGLARLLEARRKGELSASDAAALAGADLLALGALADRVRADEVGADVVLYTHRPPADDGAVAVLPADGESPTGLELLRQVAVARVTGAPRARVRVDWSRCGLELAQVALGFGASELVGPIASKRGLPLQEGELLGVGKKSQRELAQVVKRRELAGFVRRAGRVPVFVGPDGNPEPAPDERPETPTTQEAT